MARSTRTIKSCNYELTSGRHPGRTNNSQVTVCDLMDVGVQDAAIATLAYEKALQNGLGSQIEL
jgi:ornithine cyclodeaminase/alanine dehydrogenase-like protein (mu-crystallin family)